MNADEVRRAPTREEIEAEVRGAVAEALEIAPGDVRRPRSRRRPRRDLGYRAHGKLFVTGRVKDVIIKGGHNLLPAPIEQIAGAVDGVLAGCVTAVGVASQQRATELVYVVAETSAGEAEHAGIARRVRAALLAHGIAADRVELVAPGSLPRTTSGKIRRHAVAAKLSCRASSSATSAPSRPSRR